MVTATAIVSIPLTSYCDPSRIIDFKSQQYHVFHVKIAVKYYGLLIHAILCFMMTLYTVGWNAIVGLLIIIAFGWIDIFVYVTNMNI